jgi:hypothetical protein
MPDDSTPHDESLSASASPEEIEQQLWDESTLGRKLEIILTNFSADQWHEEDILNVLAVFYSEPVIWMQIKARAKQIGVNCFDLERACKFLRGRLQTAQLIQATGIGQGAIQDLGLGDWTTRLLVNTRGEPSQNAANLGAVLEHHPAWKGYLWFDAVRLRPMVNKDPLSDEVVTQIARWMGDAMRISVNNLRLLERCIVSECHKHPRDLLQEWLANLPQWDGTPRLRSWLHDVAGTKDSDYGRHISAILPISMIARALEPGVLFRHVVILEGPEELKKSTLVRALGTDEWTIELSIGLDSKEAHLLLQGAWVAEMPELDVMSRTEDPRLKAYVSMRFDSYIPKYSNNRVDSPRRTVFIGTTNETVYLRGQTGNTRFLPIAVTKLIDTDSLLRDREQIFAEALAFYLDHPDDWWQMSLAAEEEAIEQREDRRVSSVYEDDLRQWLDSPPPLEEMPSFTPPPRQQITWAEIAEGFLKIDRERWKDSNLQRQIATALRALEWEQTKEGPKDARKRIWRRKP